MLWMWMIVAGALLVMLAWLTRFPWGL
jgi:hypothetical protein